MTKKDKCTKVFQSFLPVLEKYKQKFKIAVIEKHGEPFINIDEGIFAVNIAELDEKDFEPFIAYHIQKIIFPHLCLETQRLRIRKITDKDMSDLFELVSCKEIALSDGYEPVSSESEFEKNLFPEFLKDSKRYAIELKEKQKVVGIISLREIDSRAIVAYDIGYSINKNFWRKGYAFEALNALVGFCINELKVELITAGCFADNSKSTGLLQKLGFLYEGRIRKAYYHPRYGAVDLLSCYIEK